VCDLYSTEVSEENQGAKGRPAQGKLAQGSCQHVSERHGSLETKDITGG